MADVRKAALDQYLDSIQKEHPCLAGDEIRSALETIFSVIIPTGMRIGHDAAIRDMGAKLGRAMQLDIDSLDKNGIPLRVLEVFATNTQKALRATLLSSYAMILECVEKIGQGCDMDTDGPSTQSLDIMEAVEELIAKVDRQIKSLDEN